jgi:LAS superfamily LD-carboxypeptidase LdcB
MEQPVHHTTSFDRHTLGSFAAALFVLATMGLAHAGEPGDKDSKKEDGPPTVEQIFEGAGIGTTQGCLDLTTPSQLREHRKRWSHAIDSLAEHHPALLHDWIIGADKPPKLVIEETIRQRDCMLGAMLEDAASEDSNLLLDLEDAAPTKRSMAQWAKRHKESDSTRRVVARRVDKSHYRDAAGQAFIWYRKFTFTHPRNFNLISADAAEKCGLTEGNSWRPGSGYHQKCWKKMLSADERQREILTASSAPGISRHHWGSEFDLFGLNPRHFVEGQRLYDEWQWMQTRGIEHGFFQPFLGNDALGKHTYIEERWHWSYYPIARALSLYIRDHEDAVGAALNAQWDRFETRWMGKKRSGDPYFSYVRAHWRDYMFNIADVELASIPWLSPSSLAILILLV